MYFDDERPCLDERGRRRPHFREGCVASDAHEEGDWQAARRPKGAKGMMSSEVCYNLEKSIYDIERD